MANITAAPVTPVGSLYATTPSYSGTFIPTLWSAKLNAKFYAASAFADICNRDWEGDVKDIGDKVVINNVPDIAIKDYVIGTNLNYDVPRPGTIEMSLDRGKYWAFSVSDVLDMQAKPDLMNMFTDDAGEQLRANIDSTCFYRTLLSGDVVAANRGVAAGRRTGGYNLGSDTAPIDLTTAGNDALQVILRLASVLDEQNIPDSGRWLVIDPLTRMRLMNTNLAQAQFMGDDKSMIRNGLIGTIDRFKVYVSNQLPTKAGTATVWTSGDGSEANIAGGTFAQRTRLLAAGHTCAITFASQIAKTETLPNPTDFGKLVRGMQIFGHRVVKGDAVALAVVQ